MTKNYTCCYFKCLDSLPTPEKIFLRVTNTLTIVVSILLNVFTIAIIVKTKQQKNNSVLLTFLIKLFGIPAALVTRGIFLISMWLKDYSCFTQDTVVNITLFPWHIEGYLTFAFIIDQFIHVAYPLKYSSIMTKKVKRLVLLIFFLYPSLLLLVGIVLIKVGWSLLKVERAIYMVMGVPWLVIAVILYLRKIAVLNKHERQFTNTYNKSMYKLAFYYLMLMAVTYSPAACWIFISTFIEITDIDTHFQRAIVTGITHWNFIGNSIAFLSINRKARNQVDLLIRYIRGRANEQQT